MVSLRQNTGRELLVDANWAQLLCAFVNGLKTNLNAVLDQHFCHFNLLGTYQLLRILTVTTPEFCRVPVGIHL